jgi:hypothetical protein
VSISQPIITAKVIDIVYENNDTVSFGIVAQNDTIIRRIEIINIGNSPLIIATNGISLTNFGNNSYIQSNPAITQSVNINPNQKITINIVFDTQNLGTNISNLKIESNDINNPVFELICTYEVKLQYELIVEVNGITYDDGDSVQLGQIMQLAEDFATLRITNAGVGKSIKITDLAIEGSLFGDQVPNLPFVLDVNRKNAYVLNLQFNTITRGRKLGNLSVQWELID